MSKVYRFKNTGNTCYFNTALQLLFCTSVFRSSLTRPQCELSLYLKHIRDAYNFPVNPNRAHKYYKKIFNVSSGTPEDCNECLVRMINHLNDHNSRMYSDMFVGRLMLNTQYKCCLHRSTHTEDFVSLHITDSMSSSFVDNVRKIIQPECFDVASMNCDTCKQDIGTITKQKTITKLPRVLIFNMICPRKGMSVLNLLNLGEHRYFLKGVGLYDGVHYMSCVFNSTSKTYCIINDDEILDDDFDLGCLLNYRCSVLVFEKINIIR